MPGGEGWKAPGLWPRCVLRGTHRKAGSWLIVVNGVPIQGLGMAVSDEGVRECWSMGLDCIERCGSSWAGSRQAGPLLDLSPDTARERTRGSENRGCVRGSCCIAEADERCLAHELSAAKATKGKESSGGSSGSREMHRCFGTDRAVRVGRALTRGLVGGRRPGWWKPLAVMGWWWKRARPSRRKERSPQG